MPRPIDKPSRPLTQAEIAAQQDGTRVVTGRDTSQLPQFGSVRTVRSVRYSA